MILWIGAALAECFPADADYFDALVEDAEEQLADFRPQAFQESVQTLDDQLPCASGAISNVLAARIHRLKGIEAYGQRDTDLARAAFAAARLADPDYEFPLTFLPETHPIRDAYDQASTHLPRPQPLPAYEGGFIWVDGVDAQTWDVARTSLVQVFDQSGGVQATAWVAPDQSLPLSMMLVLEPTEAPRRDLTGPLLMTTAGGAAVAAGLYGAAVVTNQRYMAEDTPDADLDALRRRNNVLVATSVGAGVVAVGGGAALVMTRTF